MADTSIEWAEVVWNPTTGCDRVSPGCNNCYALTMARRLKAMGQPKYQTDGDPRTSGPGFGLAMHHDALALPLSWRKPRRVFVNSMSDLFHPKVTDEFIARVFAVMARAPQHSFQVLTKRAPRMASLLEGGLRLLEATIDEDTAQALYEEWPLPNVWMGVSVENQEQANARIPHLRRTPAAVRWLSCEPLLEDLGELDLDGISWVVTGGESGPSYRPAQPAWFRSIRDQCLASGTAYLHKQNGGRTPKAGGRELDGHTWDQYPAVADA